MTFVLKEKKDFSILNKIKILENKKLSKNDKILVSLAKTQLRKNWRDPLLTCLNNINRGYK